MYDDPFQDEELEDLNTEDMKMIMNPELRRRRGGATTKTLGEASALIQALVERSPPEGLGIEKVSDADDKDAENNEVNPLFFSFFFLTGEGDGGGHGNVFFC